MGEARDLVHRFYDCFGKGDWEGARACYADDCITVMPGAQLDNDAHMGVGMAFKASLPDGRMEITRTVESGNEIFVGGMFGEPTPATWSRRRGPFRRPATSSSRLSPTTSESTTA